MRKGFIFDPGLCVRCRSCSAACQLENAWDFQARNVFGSEDILELSAPVLSISMACNHCEIPECLNSCPAAAYSRDPVSGAVLIEAQKCIGCRYCTWNCPYNAPKFNKIKGIIEKCNFCFRLPEEGLEPACTSACPTGALSFGAIAGETGRENPEWFPGKELNPSIQIKTGKVFSGPVIIPERRIAGEKLLKNAGEKNDLKNEWSLILFSFLSVLSVSFVFYGLFSGDDTRRFLPLTLVVLSAVFSIFHLGNKKKILRSFLNIRKSALSREIAILALYTIFISLNILTGSGLFSVLSLVTGFILLIAIDMVYFTSLSGKETRFSPGQALITGLIIISFLLDLTLPFLFIALIKVIMIAERILRRDEKGLILQVMIVRLSLLIISAGVIITGTEPGPSVIFIFLTGEFIDRILFYLDFKPLCLSDSITRSITNTAGR